VVCLVLPPETAAARRNSVLANRARSKRETAARRAQHRSKIPDLDSAAKDFARFDQRDVALRGQILLEASRREPDRARAVRVQSRPVPPRNRRRIDDHDAARTAAISSLHAKLFRKTRTDFPRARIGAAFLER